MSPQPDRPPGLAGLGIPRVRVKESSLSVRLTRTRTVRAGNEAAEDHGNCRPSQLQAGAVWGFMSCVEAVGSTGLSRG